MVPLYGAHASTLYIPLIVSDSTSFHRWAICSEEFTLVDRFTGYAPYSEIESKSDSSF